MKAKIWGKNLINHRNWVASSWPVFVFLFIYLFILPKTQETHLSLPQNHECSNPSSHLFLPVHLLYPYWWLLYGQFQSVSHWLSHLIQGITFLASVRSIRVWSKYPTTFVNSEVNQSWECKSDYVSLKKVQG